MAALLVTCAALIGPAALAQSSYPDTLSGNDEAPILFGASSALFGNDGTTSGRASVQRFIPASAPAGPSAYLSGTTPRTEAGIASRPPSVPLPPASTPVVELGATSSGTPPRLLGTGARPEDDAVSWLVPVSPPEPQQGQPVSIPEQSSRQPRQPLPSNDVLPLPEDEAAAGVAGQVIHGIAKTIDGDTLWVGSRLVRLHGIDAPDRRQDCRVGMVFWPCGDRAARRLASLADGREVTCVATVPAGEGVAAICRTAEGDLARAMVRDGLAVVARWIEGGYEPIEDEARAARRGMWAGNFKLPWLWTAGG